MNKPLQSKYPVVLSIAGSDSCGGAGIQADIKTCCAYKVYGMTAITAITAQNTLGVAGIMEVTPDMVYDQIKAVARDISPDAVKIGMVANPETVRAIADAIRDFNLRNIILDPVLVASSGDSLSGDSGDTAGALIKHLFPLCELVTPNLPETFTLLDVEPEFESPRELAIRMLANTGARNVLVKGGHGVQEMVKDFLALSREDGLPEVMELSAPRIDTPNNHGTGCTLSTAIACGLASGLSLVEAVEKGKRFVTKALEAGKDSGLGKGTGPLDFFA